MSIITQRARIEYCRSKQKMITGNLSSATNDLNILTIELENLITANQLTKVSKVGDHFIYSPLNFAPKSNRKWRKIYHLLYLCSRSVNCYIPKKWGALKYNTVDKAK